MDKMMEQAEPITLLHGRKQTLIAKADRFLTRYYRPRLLPLRFDRAVVSFSFDDIPDNAASNGARLLEEAGGRGSFYVASRLCSRSFRHDVFASREMVADLAAKGHEIGCHTYSHADSQRLSAKDFSQEVHENEASLCKLRVRDAYSSHAYPYGSVGLVQKKRAVRHFAACRSVWPGLNDGAIDMMQLRAVPLYDCLYSPAEINAMIDEAVAKKAWLIFYTHDVQDQPSDQGTSCALFAQSVAKAQERGADILTIQAASKRLYEGAGFSFSPDRGMERVS
ncbi:MAG: polysaccharide deacetylase family protein [Cohaesibacter sp.]|nr:polysaccharide deacetylase family protein [Cohaesibacter sp.]